MWGGRLEGDCCENGFVSYESLTGEAYGLSEKVVHGKTCVRGVDGAPATVKLAAVPVIVRVNILRIDLKSTRWEYDAYCRREADCGETERVVASRGVDLEALLEKSLFRAEAGDAEGVTEEPMLRTPALVSVVSYNVPVYNKG